MESTHDQSSLGIIIDSMIIPTWIFKTIKNIIKHENGPDILIILTNFSNKQNSNINSIPPLLSFYKKFDSKIFKIANDASKLVNIEELLGDIQVLKIEINENADNLEKIKMHNLDLIVSFVPDLVTDEISQCSKLGVLFPDIQYVHSELIAVEEVICQYPTTRIKSLLKKNGSTFIVREAFIATDPTSTKRNRSNYLWKNSALILRSLSDISRHGHVGLKPISDIKNCEKNYIIKNISQNITRFILRVIKRKLIDIFYFERWILMYGVNSYPFKNISIFKKLIPPKDRFWADPFMILENNVLHIFIEECIYGKNGHVSVITMNDDGTCQKPKMVLERPYHLSYPFVFKFNDNYFMIPETMENGTIEVYRCLKFPHKWEFYKNLFTDIRAVDTTLFYHNSKWWLFTVISEFEGETTWDELFLFYANDPLSDNWIPHPKNPIVSDVRNARPAGRVFHVGDWILRPSQDSSKGYGHSIVLNRITLLNETEYEETRISSIEPDFGQNINGVHSLCFEKNLTVIDAKQKTPKFG